MRRRPSGAAAAGGLLMAALTLGGCGASAPPGTASAGSTGRTGSASPASSSAAGPQPSAALTQSPAAQTQSPSTEPQSGTLVPAPDGPTAAGATTGTAPSLRGKVIVIDPGHNGGNAKAPSVVNKQVFVGNGWKACDTTGTETDNHYAESTFTWDVANQVAALLRARGATVVLTRSSNTGVGPCITERAAIGNRNHADAAISIHADGGPANGYGFHVIAPARVGDNAAIVAPSARLATLVRAAFRAGTGEPYSTYTGQGAAMTVRSDLGGLNLSRVPKIFIECANMRNASDAGRLTSPAWRQRAAAALADGLTTFLTSRG